MKLLFIDEFKRSTKKFDIYGLVAVCVDNSSYAKFKKGFYVNLRDLGWDESIEIKGRFAYSSTKGDINVSVDDRLKFVKKLFNLSKSSSGKYAVANIFWSVEIFNKGEVDEMKMYTKTFKKIIKKLPKVKNNKNGKNNIAIFLDHNDSINVSQLTYQIEKESMNRGYTLIERCFSVNSNNDTPGIVFVDHVAYFIDNFVKVYEFNKNNINRIIELFEKNEKKSLDENEICEFKAYLNNINKEETSKELLASLKKMTFC